MAFDTNVQTFTAAERLNIVRLAIASIMFKGQSYSIMGRTFTAANLKELIAYESALVEESEVAAAGENGGGIALVQIGERA